MLVLLDQVVYELCTSSTGTGAWATVQAKLIDFADQIEVWTHSGELLHFESQAQQPISSPVDPGLTTAVRAWFKSRQAYVPPDLASIVATAHSQRERASVDAAVQECKKLAKQRPDLGATLRRKNSRGESLEEVARSFVNDPVLVNAFMGGFLKHRAQSAAGERLPAAQLDPSWFAFHHGRSFLALACVYLLNYEGGLDEKVKDATYDSFANTVLDSDYAALLAYADAIATNETRDLFKMCRWMHGNAKCILTSKAVLEAEVPWGNIAEAAYHLWAEEQYGDGDDLGDWFRAESVLPSSLG